MDLPIRYCARCGALRKMVPCYGGFAVVCDCPPVETYLSGGMPQPASEFIDSSSTPEKP